MDVSTIPYVTPSCADPSSKHVRFELYTRVCVPGRLLTSSPAKTTSTPGPRGEPHRTAHGRNQPTNCATHMSSQRRPTLPFSLSHANIDRHDEAHNLLHHTMMGDGKLAAGPHAAATRATPWATLGHSNCGAMRRSTSESIVPSETLSGARSQQRRDMKASKPCSTIDMHVPCSLCVPYQRAITDRSKLLLACPRISPHGSAPADNAARTRSSCCSMETKFSPNCIETNGERGAQSSGRSTTKAHRFLVSRIL